MADVRENIPVIGDNTVVTGTIEAALDYLEIDCEGLGTVIATITGTFNGEIDFIQSPDDFVSEFAAWALDYGLLDRETYDFVDGVDIGIGRQFVFIATGLGKLRIRTGAGLDAPATVSLIGSLGPTAFVRTLAPVLTFPRGIFNATPIGPLTDGDTATLQIEDDGSLIVSAKQKGAWTFTASLPAGAATEATLSDIKTSVQIMDDWDESDRAKVNTIAGQVGVQGGSGAVSALTQRVVLATDVALPVGANVIGQVTANAGTNLNTSALALEATLQAVKTSVEIMDDWDESDRAKINPIVGQIGVAAGAGAVSASTQRVILPTDQTGINTFLDKNTTGNITALNGTVSLTTNGLSSVFLNVTGTWVATLSFEAQSGDGTWTSIVGVTPAGTASISIVSNSFIIIAVGGYQQIRLKATAFTSGTAVVTINGGAGVNSHQAYNLIAATFQVTANAGTNLNTSALALEATQSAQSTLIGAVTETAPASDTASSGLNGRLQRIAQRITSLIALIPTSLGQKTMANSFAVTVASDQSAVTAGGTFTTPAPSLTTGQTLSLQLDSKGNLFVNTDTRKASYASSVVGLAGGTSVTDLFTLTGSGTKTIRIKKINIQGSATANAVIDVLFIKRSTANSGGTSTTPTIVPLDSSDAAATAVTRAYTVNPTLGTTVGTMIARKLFLNGSSTSAAENLELEFGDNNIKAIVLRGTGEVLAINLNGLNIAGDTYNITIEWTEE